MRSSGLSPYLRLAYTRDLHRQAYSVGLVGLSSELTQDGTSAQDRYRDLGIDGSYQLLGTRHDIFTVNALAVREHQDLAATYAGGGADGKSQNLSSYNLNLSYYRKQTYGATLGYFAVDGSHDATLYGDSLSGRPNTRGEIVQLDYTPFGKEDSWLAPNVNLRLGLQYTLYNRYDDAGSHYDAAGHNASDNNTLVAFLWLAL